MANPVEYRQDRQACRIMSGRSANSHAHQSHLDKESRKLNNINLSQLRSSEIPLIAVGSKCDLTC